MSCNNIFLFLLISCVCSITTLVQSEIEPEKLVDIRNYLKKINKPAAKTIKSPDGDFIDCVLFDYPLLQGHKKKTDLPELPKGFFSDTNGTFDEEVFQLWRMSGETCPENTIPIRRTTEEDVLRASSLQTFGRKRASRNNNNNSIANSNKNVDIHEHAIGYVEDDKYYGAEAFINVWLPKVERKPEISLAQIWVIGRRSDGDVLDSIEAGSIVHNGDKHPKLFVYWTSDGYQNTGCYDLLCKGFVQVSPDVAPGASIQPVSTYNGKQYVIRVTMWKAPEDGNWWLAYNGKHVGYWPSSLFTELRDYADTADFGGEIVNTNSRGQTTTQMGSGHFCTKQKQRYGRTAYLRNLQMVNSNNSLFTPRKFGTFIDTPDRYSAQMDKGKVWGTYMYYGGPGKDDPGCT